MSTLLNWDHEINTTSLEDIQANFFQQMKQLGVSLMQDCTLAAYNCINLGFVTDCGLVSYDSTADLANGSNAAFVKAKENLVLEYNHLIASYE